MKNIIDKKLVRCFEYEGYKIFIYPKKKTEKAIEYYLLDPKGIKTKETIWIPKSSIEDQKDGIECYDIDWILDEYENRDKLEKIGFRVPKWMKNDLRTLLNLLNIQWIISPKEYEAEEICSISDFQPLLSA